MNLRPNGKGKLVPNERVQKLKQFALEEVMKRLRKGKGSIRKE